jgi:hypothetical protein
MNINNLNLVFEKYDIVEYDDLGGEPFRFYLAKSGIQINELTKVILVDIYKPEVFEPQMIGSYLKFGNPLTRFEPNKFETLKIKSIINKLPELVIIELIRLLEDKPKILNEGFGEFYDLNNYLFKTVNRRFRDKGSIGDYDFFCIIIWKANRVKSIIARMLIAKFGTLENAARSITAHLSNENMRDYDRFCYLLDIGFRLPMLSAILTVLYPDKFIVYDYRICSHPLMQGFMNLENPPKDKQKFWDSYLDYITMVASITPSWMSLRQKDEYLWGKSFSEQLKTDLANNFLKNQNIQ